MIHTCDKKKCQIIRSAGRETDEKSNRNRHRAPGKIRQTSGNGYKTNNIDNFYCRSVVVDTTETRLFGGLRVEE